MVERLPSKARPIRMRMWVLAAPVVMSLLLAGCGDETDATTTEPSTAPSTSACARGDQPDVPLARADLDGDGAVEPVSFSPPAGDCPGALTTEALDADAGPTLDWDPQPTSRDASVVRIPGRSGDLVVLLEQHARGGFQVHLFGYAAGTLEELLVNGKPVFPFVATDVTSTPLAATCTVDGFEVTEARAHQPVGVAPAWDVDRTTYAVDGNTVTEGATTEIADNVLDDQLRTQYRNLVQHSLFENCRTAS
jgi:hypothetical protein